MQNESLTADPKPPAPSRWAGWMGAALIVLAAWAAYQRSFSIPFLFDDHAAIETNPSIERLWPLGPVLSPPRDGRAVTNRPVVNLSFAVNRAMGGFAVRGYHATNLAIHVVAGLALFAVLRRTLRSPPLEKTFGGAALPLALGSALIWTVHPLQTESVSFIVQRTEALVGCWYFLLLYCFGRGVDSRRPALWQALAVLVCLLGMATKEVMVSAPVLVLFYDRTFESGTFKAAWARHGRLHAALAATWLLLLYLVALGRGSRLLGADFDPATNGWTYLLKQCTAIITYVRLAIWPHPLVMDYGTDVVRHVTDVLPEAVLLVALFVGTLVALHRRPAAGFLGLWFFAILAPSSSFVPLPAQTMAEHRMYLPLAAIVVAVVLAGYRWLHGRVFVAALVLTVAGGVLTARRNLDYQSETGIWRDTVAKRPSNARAHYNLGWSLGVPGPEKIAAFETAIRLKPDYPDAHFSLANTLLELNRVPEAISHYEQALRLRPSHLNSRHNFAQALVRIGRVEEAVAEFRLVLQLDPTDRLAHIGLANVLAARQQVDEALQHFAAVLRLDPDHIEAHYNLGTTLLRHGRPADALGHFEAVLRLRPDHTDARLNLGAACLQLNRWPEAVEHFATLVRLAPGDPRARTSLGLAFSALGRTAEAAEQFKESLRLNPDDALAREQLARLPAASGAARE